MAGINIDQLRLGANPGLEAVSAADRSLRLKVDGSGGLERTAAGIGVADAGLTEGKFHDDVRKRGAELALDERATSATQGKGFIPAKGAGGANDGLVESQAVPDMTVRVPSGGTGWNTKGKRFAFASNASIAIAAADPTFARKDLITLNPATGAVQVFTGTAAASPLDPTPTDGHVVLGRVTVAAAATTLGAGAIDDLRERFPIDASQTLQGLSVTSAKLAAMAVTTAKIDNDAVTGAKLGFSFREEVFTAASFTFASGISTKALSKPPLTDTKAEFAHECYRNGLRDMVNTTSSAPTLATEFRIVSSPSDRIEIGADITATGNTYIVRYLSSDVT